jgi:hypothetical protein
MCVPHQKKKKKPFCLYWMFLPPERTLVARARRMHVVG